MPARIIRRLSAVALLTLLLVPWAAHPDALPLFDTHLHYNVPHAEALPPEQASAALVDAGIVRAVVSTRTDELAEALMQAAPGRILPFLDVYDSPAHKQTWMHQEELPERVRARLDAGLATGAWRGIGELHLFADDRHSPVFQELLELAHRRGLPVMIHGDPAVIDRAYEIEPDALILWAHAGSFPYPPLLHDYLERYPSLYVDLSMRSERLNPPGGMPLEWQDLLIEHADRFLIGADTFSTRRWMELDDHVAGIRAWLAQLPPDVARHIGHDNAAALFAEEAAPRN
ncbi:amidohydrolase family protein [Thioalkalivibrio paradoxus]|uniref:Amidohydrolase-related domain-containing protein n=1 Tax=Thioalkalivibrio paradoxus ARh 1 TaxID=713585 RepID=W0DNF7_9GAMM|nr:amidohydrolase family protein [Thioalkalivibrio paradoxus]AHF00125.1 hypothetical protein THITH_09960 [Thioalkalivibrio paradoxus ARh 1]